MNKRFDFEDGILKCWNIVNELDALYQNCCNEKTINQDEIINILLGLKQLYDIKFQQFLDEYLQDKWKNNRYNEL
jgi:hypothetical protein